MPSCELSCVGASCPLPTAPRGSGSTHTYSAELLQLPSPECVRPLREIGSCQCRTKFLTHAVLPRLISLCESLQWGIWECGVDLCQPEW